MNYGTNYILNMKKDKSVLIVGATPKTAGIGGVSIHVQRLMDWLDNNHYSYTHCDYKTTGYLQQLKLMRQHSVVHIHISRPLPRLLYIAYCKIVGSKSILTVHGNIGRFSSLTNQIDKIAIKLCDIPILINAHSFDCARLWNDNCKFLSAFIPPLDEGDIPENAVGALTRAKDSGKKIIASNASVRSFTNNGEEIYGIDFLVGYVRYKKDYCLFISDPSGQYYNHFKEENLDNIFFISQPHSFYKLLKYADIMIRPTATDGDAISVREALSLGKVVIATNRVDRPEGVILFKYNDPDSLDSVLDLQKKHIINQSKENVVESLQKLYNSLILN